MNKSGYYLKKIFILMTLVIMLLVSTLGFAYPDDMTLDPGEHIYPCETVDKMLAKLKIDKYNARNLYNGRYYMVLGHVCSIADNDKSFELTYVNTITVGAATITASTKDSAIISKISGLNVGDNVFVYCKVSVSTWGSGSISLSDIAEVSATNDTFVMSNSYSVPSYKTICTDDMASRSLGDGLIKYYIPDEWADVEESLPLADGKYDLDGYLYRLNEISDTYTVRPEQVYVFYLDYNTFVSSKSNWSKPDTIEKELVKNILPTDSINKVGDFKVDYSNNFDCYASNYTDAADIFHRINFIFTPVGDNEGLCVIMYVFSEANYTEDIMFMLRSMELN
ncbi:MAG: hypothetical protein IKR70_05520 [Lachnospiraceae bacterium]|nr:hypothetical protein [Lachnospiraceae bacterium]